jgi:hypothetical protein
MGGAVEPVVDVSLGGGAQGGAAAGSCPCSRPVTARIVGGDLGVAFVCVAAPEWSGGWVG